MFFSAIFISIFTHYMWPCILQIRIQKSMLFKVTSAFVLLACASASADETWRKADARMEAMRKSFAEVRDHAHKVVEDEQRAMMAAEASEKKSEEALENSESDLEKSEAKLAQSKARVSTPTKMEESSFLEIPDSLSKYPKVAEDMKKVRDAERVYKDKMKALHEKDSELMALAKQDFADSKSALNLMGNLRTQRKHRASGSSFVETQELPPAFARILKAEAELKKVNDDLAKEFNFA